MRPITLASIPRKLRTGSEAQLLLFQQGGGGRRFKYAAKAQSWGDKPSFFIFAGNVLSRGQIDTCFCAQIAEMRGESSPNHGKVSDICGKLWESDGLNNPNFRVSPLLAEPLERKRVERTHSGGVITMNYLRPSEGI